MIGFNITNLLPAIIITIINYLLTRIFLLYLLLLFAKKSNKDQLLNAKYASLFSRSEASRKVPAKRFKICHILNTWHPFFHFVILNFP